MSFGNQDIASPKCDSCMNHVTPATCAVTPAFASCATKGIFLYPENIGQSARSVFHVDENLDSSYSAERSPYFPKWNKEFTKSRRRRTRKESSSASLDLILCNLNLNELSLPEVHLAMGKDGSSLLICPEKERQYKDLFERLDVDNDGRVDVNELKQAFFDMRLPQVPGQAEKFVSVSDRNQDGELDVQEFVRYLHEHEMKLRLMFKRIDQDKDGCLTSDDMEDAFKAVGIEVSRDNINKMLIQMDKNGSNSIDLDEWVDHNLLYPSADLKDIASYWKHASYVDIGESLLVPDDFSEEEKVSGQWWRQLVAGGAAGVVSRTCTAPLDRLKVLMQVHASKSNNMGVRSGMVSMLKEGGFRSLWRGNGINVVKIAPETAVKFMAYERMKVLIGAQTGEIGPAQRFVAGSSAGVISQTFIYPMEVVKTRLAIRKTGQYRGIFDCAYKILQAEGIRAFWKGYVPNTIGVIPYAGIDLCIYETLKNSWIKRNGGDGDRRPSTTLMLACSTVSSTCGQLASYPLALIRTKMQAHGAQATSMQSLVKNIVKSEGITGLYRGLAPNFMKVIPAVSISYVVYENMRMKLGVYR